MRLFMRSLFIVAAMDSPRSNDSDPNGRPSDCSPSRAACYRLAEREPVVAGLEVRDLAS